MIKTYPQKRRSVLRTLTVSALAVGVLMLGLMQSEPASAVTTTANLTVTANVTDSCTLSITSSTLSLGTGLQTNTIPVVSANDAATVSCNTGAPWTLSAPLQGGETDSARLLTSGENTLPYELFAVEGSCSAASNPLGTTGTGDEVSDTGTGSAQTVNVCGILTVSPIPASQPAGNYSESVTLTLNYT